MNLDKYKTDCIYFDVIQTKRSNVKSLTGKQSDEVIELPSCAKNAIVGSGCISDCPFY